MNDGLGLVRVRLYGHLWTTTTTGRKQYAYVEINALSSGANGKPSSSYRMAFCVEHAPYN